jgi:hypothetical protein
LRSRLISLFYFVEAVLLSAVVRFTLSFLSATIRLRWMGHAIDSNEGAGAQEQASLSPEIPLDQKQKAARVQVAITRVDRYVPWGTECYTQALTAKLMLRRRNISTTLIVGFRKDVAGEIQGHAWLKIGPYYITGLRHDIDTYVINGRFQ